MVRAHARFSNRVRFGQNRKSEYPTKYDLYGTVRRERIINIVSLGGGQFRRAEGWKT